MHVQNSNNDNKLFRWCIDMFMYTYLATFVLTCNDSDMRGDVFLFVLSAVKIIYVYNHVRVVIFNSHKNNHITLIIIVFLLLAGDEQEPAGQEIGKTKTLASCNTDHLKET